MNVPLISDGELQSKQLKTSRVINKNCATQISPGIKPN